MPEEEGLYYPDGSFKSAEQLRLESLSAPKITFDRPEGLSSSQWFQEARRRQETRNETKDNYNYARIEVEADRPFYWGLTGDWHLGQEINLEMLERDVRIIAEHPLVKGCLFLGDLTDSANFNPAQDETMLNFEEQTAMLMSILDTIPEDRITAFWKGNHDHKWESKGGTSKYTRISEKYKKPVFYGNAFLEMIVNNEFNIKMLGSHRLRGSSVYTNAHPVISSHREVQGLDIAFCGHTHRRGKIEQPIRVFNGSKMAMGCVVGTYEYGTEYTKDGGYGRMSDPEQGMWWLEISHDWKDVQIKTTEQMLKDSARYLR